MRSTKLTTLLALIALMAGAANVGAQGMPAGKWAGSWKFVLAKSQFPSAPPKVDDLTIDPDGTIRVHEVSPTDKVRDWYYTPKDGVAVAVTGRGDNVTVLVKKVSAYRIEHTWNSNGTVTHSYATLSRDGKVQTFHVEGVDKAGKPYAETVVYERATP